MPDPLSPDQVTDLRRLHEAATPGPWAWEMTGDKDNSWGVGLIIDDNDQPVAGRNEPGEGLLVEPICDGSQHPPDAELIAEVRNALPALLNAAADLAALRDATQRLDQLWSARAENEGACPLCRRPDGDEHTYDCALAALRGLLGEQT